MLLERPKWMLFYDYQFFRALENKELREYLKGRLVWCSSMMVNKGTDSKPIWEKIKVQGTYVKKS